MDDFKALLDAEIKQKRKEIQKVSQLTDKKYIKRSELENIKAEESTVIPEEKRVKVEVSPSVVSPTEQPPIIDGDQGALSSVVNEQVESVLLANSQPARLEGETDMERAKRLKSLQLKDAHYGKLNELQLLMAKLDEGEDAVKSTLPSGTPDVDPDLLTSAMKTDQIVSQNASKNGPETMQLISLFLRRLLHEQEQYLAERTEEEKKSKDGKMATLIYHQMNEHLKPLIKQLKKGKMDVGILLRLAEICSFLQQREYLKANDSYLKLAIGNAPWPIGVTAVGIHERSAQQRIATSQVAHILNDEVTRKWLQAVKRLMTFCQKKYPNPNRAKNMG